MTSDQSQTTIPAEPTDAERAEALMAAINYALDLEYDGLEWLRAWSYGSPEAMADLDNWRAATNGR